jgi:outer membrane immunogenic protein
MALRQTAIICGAFILSGAGSAQGADLPPLPQDEASYRKSWTSFSIGIGGGVGSLNTKLEATPGPGADPDSAGTNLGVDGLGTTGGFVSVSGGADYQMSNRIVVGLFLDGDFTNMSSDLHVIIPENPLDIQGSVGINDKFSVGARLGYLFWPTSLWYVSAGYTRLDFDNAKVSIQSSDTNVSSAIDVPALSGGFVGLGSETLITENISLKAEFRYTDFGSGKLGLPTIDGTNLNDSVNARLSPTMQEGRLSINYRLN